MSISLLVFGSTKLRGGFYTSWLDPDPAEPGVRQKDVAERVRCIDFLVQSPLRLETYDESHEQDRLAGRAEHTAKDEVSAGVYEYARKLATLARETRTARNAASRYVLLLRGESGSGKEDLARFFHKHYMGTNEGAAGEQSAPVVVNCGAIPETLIESELFGHCKGAFTGAVSDRVGLLGRAEGGTLFLDEIGELTLTAQTRLLRFLQDGKILRVGDLKPDDKPLNAQVIAATHRDLRAMVIEGEFREDLYYRLTGIVLEVPPLRERPKDLECEVERIRQEYDVSIDADAMDRIRAYPWPGNFRELFNVVRACAINAVVMRGDGRISLADVNAAIARQGIEPVATVTGGEWAAAAGRAALAANLELDPAVEVFEREMVRAARAGARDQKAAAEKLGLSESRCSMLTKKLGLRK